MLRAVVSLSLLVVSLTAGCHSGEPESRRASALSAKFVSSATLSFGSSASDRTFGDQSYASVAYGGGAFLTAWTSRDEYVIYAARTRASDGVLLDSVRVPLGTGDDRPAVASDGKGFLVAWAGDRTLWATRVGADGSVLDAKPLALRTGDALISQVALAFDGTNYLAVWREDVDPSYSQTQYDVRALRIRASDATVVGSMISVSALPSPEARPAVAFDGANYLVVWEDRRGPVAVLYGNRVRASDGAVLDGSAGFRVGSGFSATAPAVAFDGTNFLVAFLANGPLLGAVRIRASDRSVLDATDLELVKSPTSSALFEPPRLAYDGTHFVMTWANTSGGQPTRTYLAARIRPDTAALIDAGGIDLGTSTWSNEPTVHDVAAGSGRIMAVFNQRHNPINFGVDNQSDTSVAVLDSSTGAFQKPTFVISRSAPWQGNPASSFDGHRHLIVWEEWNSQHLEIRGGRVADRDGMVLDPGGIAISGARSTHQQLPRVASNGSNHLVAWSDGLTPRVARVSGDGAVLDPNGTVLPTSGVSPRAVASDGSDYLVLWTESKVPGGPMQIRSARIRGADGSLLDTSPRNVGPAAALIDYVQLTFSGSSYVAAWMSGNASPYEIRAARIGSDGNVLDVDSVMVAAVSGFTKEVVLAGDGQNVLVAWTDDLKAKGRRLRLSDGAVLDGSDLPLTTDYDGYVSIAFDGDNYLACWPHVPSDMPRELRLARFGRSVMPLDPSPLVVAPIAGYRHERPALSAGIGGKVLVAHHEFDDASDRRVQRVHAHLLSDPVAPPADAGVTPVDAAATGPDANTGAPDWAGQADGPGPRADAGVTDDAGAADTQGARDGAERADAGASADGGTVPDGASPLDGATAPPGADASVTDLAAPSADATHDTSAEGPGGGTSCDCRLSGRPGSGSASLAFVALAFLTRLRRRRKEIP